MKIKDVGDDETVAVKSVSALQRGKSGDTMNLQSNDSATGFKVVKFDEGNNRPGWQANYF